MLSTISLSLDPLLPVDETLTADFAVTDPAKPTIQIDNSTSAFGTQANANGVVTEGSGGGLSGSSATLSAGIGTSAASETVPTPIGANVTNVPASSFSPDALGTPGAIQVKLSPQAATIQEGGTLVFSVSYVDNAAPNDQGYNIVGISYGDGGFPAGTNGSAGTVVFPPHTFYRAGTLNTDAIVWDNERNYGQDFGQVIVQNLPPKVSINGSPAPPPITAYKCQTVSLSGSFTDPGSSVETYSYLWHVTAPNGDVVPDGASQNFSFVPERVGDYDVAFTVTDNNGGSGTSHVNVICKDFIYTWSPSDGELDPNGYDAVNATGPDAYGYWGLSIANNSPHGSVQTVGIAPPSHPISFLQAIDDGTENDYGGTCGSSSDSLFFSPGTYGVKITYADGSNFIEFVDAGASPDGPSARVYMGYRQFTSPLGNPNNAVFTSDSYDTGYFKQQGMKPQQILPSTVANLINAINNVYQGTPMDVVLDNHGDPGKFYIGASGDNSNALSYWNATRYPNPANDVAYQNALNFGQQLRGKIKSLTLISCQTGMGTGENDSVIFVLARELSKPPTPNAQPTLVTVTAPNSGCRAFADFSLRGRTFWLGIDRAGSMVSVFYYNGVQIPIVVAIPVFP